MNVMKILLNVASKVITLIIQPLFLIISLSIQPLQILPKPQKY